MKRNYIVSLMIVALTLVGCISAERKAEYAEWQASDDGVPQVMLGEFEAKYRQGWRERARKKRAARLEQEDAERLLARRRNEYNRWLASADKVDGVSLEMFEQKYKNGWEARAVQKRRSVELARKIDLYWEELAEKEYCDAIRNYNNVGRRGILAKDAGFYKDWLRDWIGPRIPKGEEIIAKGDAALEDFGMEFMPNTYSRYESAKDAAQELQRAFNDNFPEPSIIKRSDARWSAFDKMIRRLAKVRTDYFRLRDEISHYYLMYWTKTISPDELKKIDAAKIVVRLLEPIPSPFVEAVTNKYVLFYTLKDQTKVESLPENCVEFAKECMPKTFKARQNLIEEFKRYESNYPTIRWQCWQIDCCRVELPLVAIAEGYVLCAQMLNENLNDISELQVDFVAKDKDAEAIARIDAVKATRLERFSAIIKDWEQKRCNGPLIDADSEMREFFPRNRVCPWQVFAIGGKIGWHEVHKHDLFWQIPGSRQCRGEGLPPWVFSGSDVATKLNDFDDKARYELFVDKDGYNCVRIKK